MARNAGNSRKEVPHIRLVKDVPEQKEPKDISMLSFCEQMDLFADQLDRDIEAILNS